MSTLSGVLRVGLMTAAAISIGSPSPSRAQGAFDPQLVALSATEASVLASQVADSAASPSGDAETLQAFQQATDEAATLLNQIAGASLAGGDVNETQPLLLQTAALVSRAIRLSQEGGITIDPVVVDAFAQRMTELERHYYPSPPGDAPLPP